MAKSMLETSQGPAERDLPYLQWFVQAVLSNSSADGQIHVRNPKGPAERDLLSLCGRFFLHAVMRFLLESGTEDDVFLIGDACNELEGV